MKFFGGIDMGGTKIEAALFDENLHCLEKQRSATPGTYDGTLKALADQVDWIRTRAGKTVPVGLGIPGFSNVNNGLAFASNLAVNKRPFQSDITGRIQQLSLGQDLDCFALSESNGGAGQGAKYVVGMIMGTGLGSAFCVNGQLVSGRQGIIGEIGHVPVSASATERFDLPEIICGCGRQNCLENWVSGPGLSRLAGHFGATKTSPPDIIEAEKQGDSLAQTTMAAWLDLACEALLVVQLSYDPDCVVIGGGLSRIDGIAARLSDHFQTRCLPGSTPPDIRQAKFGDSSGTRGAALLAKTEHENQ